MDDLEGPKPDLKTGVDRILGFFSCGKEGSSLPCVLNHWSAEVFLLPWVL